MRQEMARSFCVGEDDLKKYAIAIYSSGKTHLRIAFKEFSKIGPQVSDKTFTLDLSVEQIKSLGLGIEK